MHSDAREERTASGVAHMPDAQTLASLRDAAAADAPIVVANLIRYAEPDGREQMAAYGAITAKLLAAAGGELIFAGRAGPELAGCADTPEGGWDDVLLVRFPDAGRFIAMIASAEYVEQAAPIRARAVAHTVWLPVLPYPGFEGRGPALAGPDATRLPPAPEADAEA